MQIFFNDNTVHHVILLTINNKLWEYHLAPYFSHIIKQYNNTAVRSTHIVSCTTDTVESQGLTYFTNGKFKFITYKLGVYCGVCV